MSKPEPLPPTPTATPPSPFGDWLDYLKASDLTQLEAAYRFSEQAHSGQFRKSGEPYIAHPLAVARILAQWHLDAQALTAALLHDVVEDTLFTTENIESRFGKPVAELVDGVSKLDRIEFESVERAQAENFRKMLLAMARDVRVMLIKLADRLHNMRTLAAVDAQRRQRIAHETLDIYAPIANRLGLNSIYQEMEDLAFQNLYPERHRVLTKAMRTARGNRREIVNKVIANIKERLAEYGVVAEIQGREKHIYSVYQKMREKHLSFAQVHDIFGFRIIVKDMPACYVAMGVLHSLYKPIPGKFKDYIAIPKANGYQSLHTSLFGPVGGPIEFQIRTNDMHKIAEAGVASHWLYKSANSSLSELQKKTHQWLQSLLEMQTESGDSIEFLEHLKVDLFPDEVYVFTPKGKILSLPREATAVDFAYAVHTDIGNRCVAVKINQSLMPLRTILRNGDRIEIVTASHAKPNPLWLNFVVTAKARAHIRHFVKTLHFSESVQLGSRLLQQAMHQSSLNVNAISEYQWQKLIRDTGAKNRDNILSDIGLGKRLAIVVAHQLLASNPKLPATPRSSIPVIIRGSEGIAVQFSRCCGPIPGDQIIGIISKGQGMAVHTQECMAINKNQRDPERLIDLEWDANPSKLFDVGIRLVVANQRGVLATVAAEISSAESNIQNVTVDPDDGGTYTVMRFTVQVKHRMHLARIVRNLRKIPEVVRISRVKGS
jgi:GTP pyrophosphokinase